MFVLNLTVNPTYEAITNAAICEGGTYDWRGNSYTALGIYTETLQTANGCDSVFVLNLTVNPVYFSASNMMIYDSQLPYQWEGSLYWTAGTYYKYYQTAAGCDSTLQLNLSLNTSGEIWVNKNIGTAVQANWSAVSGATSYKLRYAIAGTQNWTYHQTSLTRFRIVNLTPATLYDIEVQYYDGSVWSDWTYFMPVQFETEVVSFTFVRDIGTRAIVEWTPLPDVSSYILQYKKSTSTSWTNSGEYTANTATVNYTLEDNTDYEFRVIVRYAGTSLWYTQGWPLTTLNYTYEFTKDIGTKAILNILPIADVTRYAIYWKEAGASAWKLINTTNSNTAITFNNLIPGGQYTFKVDVYFNNAKWGTTAEKTISTNVVNVAVTNYTGTEATFIWDPVVNPDASAFYLQTRAVGNTSWASKYSKTNTATVTGLTQGVSYEYRLVVRYGNPESSWGITQTQLLVGAKENAVALQNSVNVYPNPVINVATIEVYSTHESDYIWNVLDMTGRIVLSGAQSLSTGINTMQIDLTQLNSGLYMLYSDIQGEFIMTRIIRE
jgi:hypothetical protein